MDAGTPSPILLAAIVAAIAGTLMVVQGRLQTTMLRRRLTSGVGTVVVDPATGLFSAAAAWQCIRAEANRSARLERPLTVLVGSAPDAASLDEHGRALAFDLPAGTRGIRIARRHVCLITCADALDPDPYELADMAWSARSIEPSATAANEVLAFVSEVTGA